MGIHTFSGETAAQALQKARAKFGDEVRLVTTKQLKKATIGSAGLYEIVILADEEDEKPIQNIAKKPPINAQKFKSSEDVLLNISQAAKQISQIAEVTTDRIDNTQNHITSVPLEELKSIKKEITQLSDKIKSVQHMFWEDNAPKRNHLEIPPEFSEIYKLALQSDMQANHLDEIMRLTLKHMPASMKHSSLTIKRYFQVLLRKMIPTRAELNFTKGQQKAMMLVGPTGVGKTTTLAKLAARFSTLNEKRYKVGFITLDTYRIGAVEQLFSYAKMMHMPMEDVLDVNDFELALQNLKHCDIVLIDTVGSSQYDKDKLMTLDVFLRNTSTQIDVSLVMSAGTKLQDLREIYENYSFLDIDTIIFTKLDETKMFGNIFSLTYDIQKPISYLSVGQEVPDDLKSASSSYLVSCMLDGFRKEHGDNSSK